MPAFTVGNGDSSPSRDKVSNRSASEQPADDMNAEQAEPSEPGMDAAAKAEPGSSQATASTPQRPPAQEASMHTPQRMASASAFSVFMSPLVKGSGLGHNAHVFCGDVRHAIITQDALLFASNC